LEKSLPSKACKSFFSCQFCIIIYEGTYKVLKLEIHRVLEFNQLSGKLPSELGNLHQLERL
jgi:hypothetical protein